MDRLRNGITDIGPQASERRGPVDYVSDGLDLCVRRMKAFPILLPHHRSNAIVGTRRTTHRPACNSLRECVDHEHNVQPQRWHVEIPTLLAAYNCQLACHPLSVSGHERIFTSRAMAARFFHRRQTFSPHSFCLLYVANVFAVRRNFLSVDA